MLYNSDYTIVEQKTETTVDKKIPTTTQLPQKEVKTTNIETQSLKTETITKRINTHSPCMDIPFVLLFAFLPAAVRFVVFFVVPDVLFLLSAMAAS